MAQSTSEQSGKYILQLLTSSGVSTVVLVGNHGVGKTWMARKICGEAISEGKFDRTLWAYLYKKYDEKAIHLSFARQMSLLSTNNEWLNDDNVEVEEEKEEDLHVLKEKIYSILAGERLLLVLDNEGSAMNTDQFMELIDETQRKSWKKLITSVDKDRHRSTKVEKEKVEVEKEKVEVIEVMHPSFEKSFSMLRQRSGPQVFEIPGVERLANEFIKKNNGLTPVAIVRLTKALSNKGNDSAVQVLERALEESSVDGNYSFMQLLHDGYDKVPDGVLMDYSWQGGHFFRDRPSFHFSELISYWIMEGYLGNIDCIEKAYEEGHRVLMELIDCEMLKKVEDDNIKGNYIRMESVELNLAKHRRFGFRRTARLGLANVFEDGKWDGFGEVTQADGMVKSVPIGKKKLSTLLLDGNRMMSREASTNFFQSEQDLKVIALFNPRFSALQSLSTMNKLNVLVLRGCDLLMNIEHIIDLTNLSVLEISGASSLKDIPDIFTQMTQLRSLTLSDLRIEKLPRSFYQLIELRWLILKGCSRLKQMESLKKFEKLFVLNLSNVTSLIRFPDKSLKSMPKLETLDLSNTSIKSMPIFREIKSLTHLSLSNCQSIDRLRSIQSLSKLQVLDLSGSRVKELRDQSLEKNHDLRVLDLSRTEIPCLPSNISNPSHLYLKGCLHLKQLSHIESLKDLELLDLSGASGLEQVDDNFFENLTNLQVLNLSETKLKGLPLLSTLCNLRQLLLSCCSSLVKLPALNSLAKLEVLDLSGCNALTAIGDESFEHMSHLQRLNLCNTKFEKLPSLEHLRNLEFLSFRKCNNLKLEVEPPLDSLSNLKELNFCGVSSLKSANFLEHMSHLRILDLSETELKELPSMSKLKNLVHLSLRGCQQVETVPDLELLTKLEILDLSGTAVSNLPSLSNFSNLRQLLPGGCLSQEEIKNEVPNQSRVSIEEVPYGISESTQLEHLDLPNISSRRGESIRIEQSPEEQWAITSLPGSVPDSSTPFISVSSSEFFELLKKDPHLWDKSFKQFQFSVYPIDEKNELRGIYLHKDKLISRDIELEARHLSHFKKQGRSLEIHGFRFYPKGIEDVLSRSEYIFLFDNSFITRLSELGADNMKMMRGCWIERCANMERVVLVAKAEDTGKMENTLEILLISYAIKLKTIYGGSEGFRNLKCLYLDCCPELQSVFSLSQRPENLEILRISFCDKLKSLFENKSEECILPKLRVLHLWELPELKSIGCPLPNSLSLEARECPMLVIARNN